MEDVNKVPDGTEGKKETEQEQKSYSAEEFKKVIAQRQEAKENERKLLSELETIRAEIEKQKQDKMKEDGDLKQLLELKEKEIIETKNTLKEISEYKTKYEDLDKSIRKNLISQLPEELHEIAEDLGTAKLQKFVEVNKTNAVGMDSGKTGKTKIKIEGKKWNDFSSKDLEAIRNTDFAGYSSLYKDKFGILPAQ